LSLHSIYVLDHIKLSQYHLCSSDIYCTFSLYKSHTGIMT